MTQHEVERYRKPTRILHWVHLVSFCVLFLSGLVLFLPPLAILAQDSWTRLLHRIAMLVFIVAPLIYIPMNWKSTCKGVKDAFTWGKEDIDWLKAAPRYYVLCDEEAMPPQPHMNAGQKLWWFMVIVFSVVFIITGFIMGPLHPVAPAAAVQWAIFVHDVAFIATGCMLFVHIYTGVFHPLMRPLKTGPWNSMITRGTVSVDYAKSHHGKWYEEVVKAKEAQSK